MNRLRWHSPLWLFMALVLISVGVYPLAAAPMTQSVGWWDARWEYRVSLAVRANGHARADKPAEIALNFTTLLATLGQSGALDENSLRVVELNGSTFTPNVLFQFDKAANYNKTSNAAGTLLFMLAGGTASNATRTFQLYFDREGEGFAAPNFTDQTVFSTHSDEGQASWRVQTTNATWFYQPAAGGFSSLEDVNGNDWLNYHPQPAASAGGAYRGVPNMVYPEGKLHPGATGHATVHEQSGPLKESFRTTIQTDSDNRQWDMRWEIFPTYARMTVLDVDHDYWFLYEGTPGGAIEPTQDFVVRSNGTQTPITQNWNGDLPAEEWLYFADPAQNRSLFLVQEEGDTILDSYKYQSDAGGDMTVFGFGRQNSPTRPLLSARDIHFTLGLVESTAYAATAALIRGSYQPLGITVAAPEQLGGTGQTTITLIKDAQPNAPRNFRFSGGLGVFVLDDANPDDGDAYVGSKSFTVSPGSYIVTESAATGWPLTSIACNPAASATVNLANRRVTINAGAGASVTCTFINSRTATLSDVEAAAIDESEYIPEPEETPEEIGAGQRIFLPFIQQDAGG